MAHDELEITIDANGRVTMRTLGVKGPRCLDYAEWLAQLVGREESRELTTEYYETEQHSQNHSVIRERRQ